MEPGQRYLLLMDAVGGGKCCAVEAVERQESGAWSAIHYREGRAPSLELVDWESPLWPLDSRRWSDYAVAGFPADLHRAIKATDAWIPGDDPEADMMLHCAGESLDSDDAEAVEGAEMLVADLAR